MDWVPWTELLCGEEWELRGTTQRILLGPDIKNRGIHRLVAAVSLQPQMCFFKSEMEIDLLSTIHRYGISIADNDVYTDGSVVQEMNPVVNAMIPSPHIARKVGKSPLVSGSLIARCESPAAHGMEVAFRAEDGPCRL